MIWKLNSLVQRIDHQICERFQTVPHNQLQNRTKGKNRQLVTGNPRVLLRGLNE